MSNNRMFSLVNNIAESRRFAPDTQKIEFYQIRFELNTQTSEQELRWVSRRLVISVFSPAAGLSALDKWGRSCGDFEARHLAFLFEG
jgi:hypothetical protein